MYKVKPPRSALPLWLVGSKVGSTSIDPQYPHDFSYSTIYLYMLIRVDTSLYTCDADATRDIMVRFIVHTSLTRGGTRHVAACMQTHGHGGEVQRRREEGRRGEKTRRRGEATQRGGRGGEERRGEEEAGSGRREEEKRRPRVGRIGTARRGGSA